MNASTPSGGSELAPDVRATLRWVSGAALISPIFLVAPSGDAYRWVDMSVVSTVVAVVAGVMGLFAASGGRRVPAVVAGGLCLTAALVRMAALLVGAAGPIGGSAATMTFLGGLALAYLTLAAADRLLTPTRR